jgi:ubiquinone/menaquinone biosynthesis C-methylase UbiE
MQPSPYLDAEVAEAYDELALPLQFAAPADDLVAFMQLSPGVRVLDVGTGTGAIVARAAAALGSKGLAVGVDQSAQMLQHLRKKGAHAGVVARIPTLPFPSDTFDAVLAGFVLPHCHDYEQALAEMGRVLRPGGRLGVSTWVMSPNAVTQLWNDIVTTFTDVDSLKRDFTALIPWDEKFADEALLREALTHAGFANVQIARRTYETVTTVADYLRLKESGVEGVLLRRRLDSVQWNDFRRRAADALGQRFSEHIEYSRDANIVVSTKPERTCVDIGAGSSPP